MIDLVCGLSKSGKTTLIRRLDLAGSNVQHVRASSLLALNARPTIGLSAGDVVENQKTLVNNLLPQLVNNVHIILDGHLLLETTEGPQLVPMGYLDPLPIAGVTFVSADPVTIARRRQVQNPAELAHQLGRLAKLEEEFARLFADVRGIPFTSIDNDDLLGFTASIKSHLRIR